MKSPIPALAVAAMLATHAAAQERFDPPQDWGAELGEYQDNVRRVLREAFDPGERYEIFSRRPSRQVWTYHLIAAMKSGEMGVMSMDGQDLSGEKIGELEAGLPANPADLPLSRCAVAVDPATAAALLAAWQRMIEEVRPGDEPRMGADGTSYLFSMEPAGRTLVGET